MRRSIKYTIFVLLLVAGALVCSNHVANNTAVSIDDGKAMVANNYVHKNDATLFYNIDQQLPSGNSCSAQSISCNNTLQLYAVTALNMVEPVGQSDLLWIASPSFVSKTVVFREPDPPKTV